MPAYGDTSGGAVQGGFAFGADISPTQLSASQNDYAPTGYATAVVYRLDLSAAWSITGFAGGADGQVKIIENISAFVLTLVNASGSSTAANRLDCTADVAVVPKATAILVYDSTASRWKVVAVYNPKATTAEVYAGAADRGLRADHVTAASALIALTDAATTAVDWTAGINFSWTAAGNRALGNPTNGIPGTWRTITLQGSASPDQARTITFGNQYLGTVPTITDASTTKWYLLTIFCVTSSHFAVSSQVIKS